MYLWCMWGCDIIGSKPEVQNNEEITSIHIFLYLYYVYIYPFLCNKVDSKNPKHHEVLYD